MVRWGRDRPRKILAWVDKRVASRLFSRNNFATPAALAEVCALLSAVLVRIIVTRRSIRLKASRLRGRHTVEVGLTLARNKNDFPSKCLMHFSRGCFVIITRAT